MFDQSNRDVDCAGASPSGTGVCVTIVGTSGLLGHGVCEVPEVPEVFCERPDAAVDERTLIACYRLPHSDTLTPSWFDGDCDDDGCPNANDPSPCAVTSEPCDPTSADAFRCVNRRVNVPAERCAVESATCAFPHACVVAGMTRACPVGFACAAGACEPSQCSSFYACRSVDDCQGAPSELGTPVRCQVAGGLLDSTVGSPRDGFCVFDTFHIAETRCSLSDGTQCFRIGGTTVDDFFQGDCDGDGCPNLLDEDSCDASRTGPCDVPMDSPACAMRVMPPVTLDGGVDAGSDAGPAEMDAATTVDGGVPPSISFYGGGGCRCGVLAAPTRGGALVLVVPLVLLARRRRPRGGGAPTALLAGREPGARRFAPARRGVPPPVTRASGSGSTRSPSASR